MKNIPKVIQLFYTQRFFHHLNFFWAVDKLFFANKDMDPFQISLLLAIWSAYTLIFEVPSGAIADRWSRRWIMVIGSIFHTLAYFVWFFAFEFWGLLLGYIFRGTGSFLQSGTKEAMVYDHLKALGKESDYEKYTGYLWVVTSAAFLCASLFSGFIADRFSYGLVIILTIVTNLISTIYTYAMPDAPKSKSTEELSYFKFIKSTWKKAMNHPLLLQIMFYALTVLVVDGVLDEYDQLYIAAIGLPLAGFGIWWGIRMGAEMLAGLVAHRLKVHGRERVLNVIALITFVLLTLASFINSLLMIGVVALCFFLFAVAVILNEARLQELIESHERATINSINSLLKNAAAIIAGLGYGYIAKIMNPRIAMLVFSFIILIYIINNIFRFKQNSITELYTS